MAANKVTAVRLGLGEALDSPGLSKPPSFAGGFFLRFHLRRRLPRPVHAPHGDVRYVPAAVSHGPRVPAGEEPQLVATASATFSTAGAALRGFQSLLLPRAELLNIESFEGTPERSSPVPRNIALVEASSDRWKSHSHLATPIRLDDVRKARILIGTSGWHYASWRGLFFPAWREQTGRDFLFAWKTSKFITHWKRLSGRSENSLALLEDRISLSRGKAGPILFQLPPQFEVDPSASARSSSSDPGNAATVSNSSPELVGELVSDFTSFGSGNSCSSQQVSVHFGIQHSLFTLVHR